MQSPIPSEIKLHRKSRQLELIYANGESYHLTYEFLRVHSPSAEVRGHGSAPGVLPMGKSQVNITRLETVGNYAVKPSFDDGHDSGIYSWQYLMELCLNQQQLWQSYREKVAQRGVIPLTPVQD